MKIFIFVTLFILQLSLVSNAQSTNGANAASNGASSSGMIMGATSVGMGTTLIALGLAKVAKGAGELPTPAGIADQMMGHMEEMTGASLVVGGVGDFAQAGGYQNTGNQIASTGDPTSPSSTDGVGGLDGYTQGLLDQANALAAQAGTTLPALANQAAAAGDGGGGGGGLGDLASQLSPADKAKVAKAAAAVAAHYNVSSVALEGGGGGQHNGSGVDSGLDIGALLKGLKGDRASASVAGLQKSLNGEAIGVAQDNIFKQVTRKYQSKIAARMFLPIKK